MGHEGLCRRWQGSIIDGCAPAPRRFVRHLRRGGEVREIKLPRKTGKKHPYLNGTQVELLASHSDAFSTFVYVLACTGIRWGEATGLRVASLDSLRHRMLIEENAVRLGGEVVVGTPKTHEKRSVVYPKFLGEPIARLCDGKEREEVVFGDGDTYLTRAAAAKAGIGRQSKRHRRLTHRSRRHPA